MDLIFKTSHFNAIIDAPPSKSHEQRLLAACLLSNNTCVINNCGNSEDVSAAREIICQLGSDFTVTDNKLTISHRFDKNENQLRRMILNCKESALCTRLFGPIACLYGRTFTLTGKGTLLNRDIANSFTVLDQMGCKFESTNNRLPIHFIEPIIKSGNYEIDGSSSSQFISGLIFSLPIVDGGSRLTIINPVSINYILMTIQVVEDFGIKLSYSMNDSSKLVIEIPGNQSYKSKNVYKVEGDWSGEANFLVAGAVNKKIGVKGLLKDSLQPDKDILKVFDLARIKYYWENDILIVEKSNVKAFDFDATNCPDLIPVITVLAAFANGESHIYGASRLASKESSRAEVLQKELTKVKLNIIYKDDMLQIIGNGNYDYAEFDSHHDHRIAMALTIFGILSEKGAYLKNCECVAKSYPNFYRDLEKTVSDFDFNIALV